jgi:hypothetical protein
MMGKRYSLELCVCPKSEKCEFFGKMKKAFDSLPEKSIPSAIFASVKFSLEWRGSCLYNINNGIDNQGTCDGGELFVFLRCRLLLDHTVRQLQMLLVTIFCDIAGEEVEPYLERLFNRKKFFQTGFECGSSGEMPRLEFDAEQEEQAYNEGYSKGQIAALVRAANRFLTY